MTRHCTWPALAAATFLVGCKPAVREPSPAELACAGPGTVSLVNFRFVMDNRPEEPLPPGAELLSDLRGERFVVRRRIVISGLNITKVRQDYDGQGPAIAISFNEAGAAELEQATRGTGPYRRMALVGEGVVIAAFPIDGPIVSNSILIHGMDAAGDTSDLAGRIQKAAHTCILPPGVPPPAP